MSPSAGPRSMSRDRFALLAAAWGADLECWPPSERAPARAFQKAHQAETDAILTPERVLDAALDAALHPSAPPPPFLHATIAARVLSRRPSLHRFRAWIAGAAAAAALAGGLSAGIAVATLAAPFGSGAPSLYGVSVLGAPFDPGAEDDGGSAPEEPDAS